MVTGTTDSRSDTLGTVAPDFEAAERRRSRFVRRQRSGGWLIGAHREEAGLPRDAPVSASDPAWIRPPRPARCGWRVSPVVGVHFEPGRAAHFSGTERCSSAWACPSCAAVVRGGRALDLEQAASVAADRRYGGMFVTLTLRHSAGHRLADLIDLLMSSWRTVQQRKWFRDFRSAYDVVGMIRATEITYGLANGWHPHLHVWIMTEGSPSKDARDAFRSKLSAQWRSIVESRGPGANVPSDARGVDVRAVTSTGVAQYVGKMQEDKCRKIGSELVRSDLKFGRDGSMVPFELLDAEGSDVPRARALWVEYVRATKGRHVLTWSRGLRDDLGIGAELTDEEIIEQTESSPRLFVISAETYDRGRRDPQWLSDVLWTTECDPATAEATFGADAHSIRAERSGLVMLNVDVDATSSRLRSQAPPRPLPVPLRV